jgi:hypothetical protein
VEAEAALEMQVQVQQVGQAAAALIITELLVPEILHLHLRLKVIMVDKAGRVQSHHLQPAAEEEQVKLDLVVLVP